MRRDLDKQPYRTGENSSPRVKSGLFIDRAIELYQHAALKTTGEGVAIGAAAYVVNGTSEVLALALVAITAISIRQDMLNLGMMQRISPD